MRLCYLADARSIHTHRWLDYFVQQGHEVHLLSIHAEFPSLEGVKIYDISPLPAIFAHKVKRGLGWLSVLFSSWRIRQLLQDIQPDLLHVHFAAYLGWMGALTGFHPLVITLWGSDILADQGGLTFPKNLITPLALKRADLITGVSQYLLDAAAPHLNPDTARHVIRIGADLNNFHPNVDADLWRTRLGLDNQPVILSPRSFSPVYNIETIVAAIPYVLKEIPEARFVFKDYNFGTGSDAYSTQIRQMIADMDIGDAVRYVDKVSYNEMAMLYRMSDVVVSVSLSDGFPVTMLETMACGVPMVLSQLPHLAELIVDGRNALTIPSKEPKQLAAAILQLLRDETLRQNMIAANLELVRTYGNFEAEMQKMEQLYEGLI